MLQNTPNVSRANVNSVASTTLDADKAVMVQVSRMQFYVISTYMRRLLHTLLWTLLRSILCKCTPFQLPRNYDTTINFFSARTTSYLSSFQYYHGHHRSAQRKRESRRGADNVGVRPLDSLPELIGVHRAHRV